MNIEEMAVQHMKAAFTKYKKMLHVPVELTKHVSPDTGDAYTGLAVYFGKKDRVVFLSSGEVRAEVGSGASLTWPYNMNILIKKAAGWRQEITEHRAAALRRIESRNMNRR